MDTSHYNPSRNYSGQGYLRIQDVTVMWLFILQVRE